MWAARGTIGGTMELADIDTARTFVRLCRSCPSPSAIVHNWNVVLISAHFNSRIELQGAFIEWSEKSDIRAARLFAYDILNHVFPLRRKRTDEAIIRRVAQRIAKARRRNVRASTPYIVRAA